MNVKKKLFNIPLLVTVILRPLLDIMERLKKKIVTTAQMIRKVKKLIERNQSSIGTTMARELKISKERIKK